MSVASENPSFSALFDFLFQEGYEKSAPEFVAEKCRAILWYLIDGEVGTKYDLQNFNSDMTLISALRKHSHRVIAEDEALAVEPRMNTIEELELGLMKRASLKKALNSEPFNYIALQTALLAQKYTLLTQGEGPSTDTPGEMLLEIGQGMVALRNWAFDGTPANHHAILAEKRRNGKKGAQSRDFKKHMIIRRFIDQRESGRLKAFRFDAAAYREFVSTLTPAEKLDYRGSRSETNVDPSEIDVLIEQSLKKAYQKYKREKKRQQIAVENN